MSKRILSGSKTTVRNDFDFVDGEREIMKDHLSSLVHYPGERAVNIRLQSETRRLISRIGAHGYLMFEYSKYSRLPTASIYYLSGQKRDTTVTHRRSAPRNGFENCEITMEHNGGKEGNRIVGRVPCEWCGAACKGNRNENVNYDAARLSVAI